MGSPAFSLKTIISTFGTLHTALTYRHCRRDACLEKMKWISSFCAIQYRVERIVQTSYAWLTKRLRSDHDRLSLQGPTNTHSGVASARSLQMAQSLYHRQLQWWWINHQKTCFSHPGILSMVPNNDQVLGSTRIATPLLHVPNQYQYELKETNHVHKIMTIFKMWNGVPHINAGEKGINQSSFIRLMAFLTMAEVARAQHAWRTLSATKLVSGNTSIFSHSSQILARTDHSLLYEISSEEMNAPVWGRST